MPDNVIPNNYFVLTKEFEKPNTEFNKCNMSTVNGDGIYINNKHWKELSHINRPWFQECVSNMQCKIVKGTLEKFNYEN